MARAAVCGRDLGAAGALQPEQKITLVILIRGDQDRRLDGKDAEQDGGADPAAYSGIAGTP